MRAKSFILKTLLLILCFISSIGVMAQTQSYVTGVVVDENGESLPGASVVIMKGKNMVKGTSTGIEGEFKLAVDIDGAGYELVVS